MDQQFNNSKKLLTLCFIAIPIVFFNHNSWASQTILMECEFVEESRYYDETVYPTFVEEKSAPKIERYTVTTVDDNQAFIGNMKNCAFEGPRLICRQEEAFKDIVKNK